MTIVLNPRPVFAASMATWNANGVFSNSVTLLKNKFSRSGCSFFNKKLELQSPQKNWGLCNSIKIVIVKRN
jgi:hypothetical protein